MPDQRICGREVLYTAQVNSLHLQVCDHHLSALRSKYGSFKPRTKTLHGGYDHDGLYGWDYWPFCELVPPMKFTVNCACGKTEKFHLDGAERALRSMGSFGFGQHVSDPRAFVMRAMRYDGWRYDGGRLGKSTITMVCYDCEVRTPEFEIDPEDAGKSG